MKLAACESLSPGTVKVRKVSSEWTGAVVRMAQALGFDVEAALIEAGIDIESLNGRHQWLPVDVHLTTWSVLTRVTGRSDFGLLFAEKTFDAGALGPVGYLCMSSATTGEALTLAAKYRCLFGNDGTIRHEVRGDELLVSEMPCGAQPPWPVALADACMAKFALLAARWIKPPPRPRRLSFQHPRPAHFAAYERIFDCPISFEQPHNQLVFDRTAVDLPLSTAQPQVHAALEEMVRTAAEIRCRPSIAVEIMHAIERIGFADRPSVTVVAGALGMSARSLQRRLQRAGQTFASLVDAARCNAAMALLRETSLSVDSVGVSLGFSDARAFRRAVKRWTGLSPQQHRSRPHR